MKIALITDYNKYTGIGAQNYALWEGFKKNGVDIDIINLVSRQGFKSTPDYGENIIVNKFNNVFLDFAYGVFYIFPKKLDILLIEKKYDFVIIGHQGLAYLHKVLDKNNISNLIIVHDLFTMYPENRGDLRFWIYNKFLIRGLESYKNIVFVSDFTRDDFQRFYHKLPEKYQTIYEGWDAEEKKLSEDEINKFREKYGLGDKKIILHIGSEDNRKNVKTFLEIVNHYKHTEELLWVRIGKKSQESGKYIDENKLDNILYFSGIDDVDFEMFFRIARIFVYTSLLEGFGKPLFQSYKYNTLIISTKISDAEKIFDGDRNVFLVDNPMDKDEYIKYIDEILNNDIEFAKQQELLDTKQEARGYLEFMTKRGK